jgi:thiol:disulfide interchange protein/DsbC/DsbD-like thiol-disulfide interchange protein
LAAIGLGRANRQNRSGTERALRRLRRSVPHNKKVIVKTFVRVSALFCSFVLLLADLSLAEPADEIFAEDSKYVHASLVFDRNSVQPVGSESDPDLQVGVLLRIEPGWHIYWRNSGESGLPTKVTWDVPEGWRVGALQWPIPQKFKERGDITTFGYGGEVLLSADLFAPAIDPHNEQRVAIGATVRWLACKDICIPGQASLKNTVAFSASAPLKVSAEFDLFKKYEQLFPHPLPSTETGELSQLELTLLTDKEQALPNETLQGLLVVTGISSAVSRLAAKHLQLFAYENEYLSVGNAQVAPLKRTNGSRKPESEYLIKFPITISAETTPGDYQLGGILALSALAAESNTAAAYTWTMQINVGTGRIVERIDPRFIPLTRNAAPFRPLTFLLASESQIQKIKPTALPVKKAGLPLSAIAAAIFAGIIGGILLNLMPCVLPIMAIKAMGFVDSVQQSRTRALGSAAAFAGGVILSFLLLGCSVLVLRFLGYQLGWGFQFQHPAYVLVLLVVVYIIALGFFDVYTVSLPGTKQANEAMSGLAYGYVKHFFDGVLTTALSTPCTAPFLGTALIVAFTQPAFVTLLIFFSIGLGLALPYVFLATHPGLTRRLPAPGPWIIRFRQLMGFLLLATVTWLLFVLDRLTEGGAVWSCALLILIYFAFWLRSWAKDSGRALTVRLVTLLGIVLCFAFAVTFAPLMLRERDVTEHAAVSLINWRPYSPELLESEQAAEKPVFLVFTADWCLTCKANELLVIETDKVAQALRERGITPIRADWTTGNEKVTAALKSFGAEGVPLYVIIPAKPGTQPIVLPTLLTTGKLISAFDKTKM